MTPIKCLSVAMIAIAMLTTSAMAHASASGRYGSAIASPRGQWTDSNARMPAPSAGEVSAAPHDEPGGVCDHGDNPMIC